MDTVTYCLETAVDLDFPVTDVEEPDTAEAADEDKRQAA